MKDDISEIPTTGCNYLSNSETIYNYNSNVRRTYRFVGGKWFYTQQDNYSTMPSGYQCIDITELSSNAVFEPFLYFVSFCLFIVCVYMFYFVIRKLLYAVKM